MPAVMSAVLERVYELRRDFKTRDVRFDNLAPVCVEGFPERKSRRSHGRRRLAHHGKAMIEIEGMCRGPVGERRI